VLIKVCGMREVENIRDVSSLEINFMGFIFFRGSKRYIEQIPVDIPAKIKKVGVFVNHETEELIETAKKNSLDYIQLHGDEDKNYCLKITAEGFKIIKVFRVDEDFNFELTKPFEEVSDYFLFDTKAKDYGGTGKKFNWAILQQYQGSVPFLLSGGISGDDHVQINNIRHKRFSGIDLNSRFEIKPALKDFEKIYSFINKVKRI